MNKYLINYLPFLNKNSIAILKSNAFHKRNNKEMAIKINYQLKINFAKEIIMICLSKQGKRYFKFIYFIENI